MDACLDEVEREIGKPALRMNREEKLRALSYLDSRGVLQINKAGVRLCEFLAYPSSPCIIIWTKSEMCRLKRALITRRG